MRGSPSAACKRVALQSVLSAAPTHASKWAPVSASVKGTSGLGSARHAWRCASVLGGISGVAGHIFCMHSWYCTTLKSHVRNACLLLPAHFGTTMDVFGKQQGRAHISRAGCAVPALPQLRITVWGGDAATLVTLAAVLPWRPTARALETRFLVSQAHRLAYIIHDSNSSCKRLMYTPRGI